MAGKTKSEIRTEIIKALARGEKMSVQGTTPEEEALWQEAINEAASMVKAASPQAYETLKLETESNNPGITVTANETIVAKLQQPENAAVLKNAVIKQAVQSLEFRADMVAEFYETRNKNRSEFNQTVAENRSSFNQTVAENRSNFDQTVAENRSNFDQTVAENRAAQEAQARLDQKTMDSMSSQAKSTANRFNQAVDNSKGTQHKTENGLSYTVSENGISYTGNAAKYYQQASELLPKVYEVEKNSEGKTVYICGPAVASIYNVINMAARNQLGNDLGNYEISKDIQKRQQNGETITAQEQALVTQNQQRLAAWGLVEKDGKLVQTNPRAFLIHPTRVADMEALEKQVAKDKKAAAKENPALKKLLADTKSH